MEGLTVQAGPAMHANITSPMLAVTKIPVAIQLDMTCSAMLEVRCSPDKQAQLGSCQSHTQLK